MATLTRVAAEGSGAALVLLGVCGKKRCRDGGVGYRTTYPRPLIVATPFLRRLLPSRSCGSCSGMGGVSRTTSSRVRRASATERPRQVSASHILQKGEGPSGRAGLAAGTTAGAADRFRRGLATRAWQPVRAPQPQLLRPRRHLSHERQRSVPAHAGVLRFSCHKPPLDLRRRHA
ncbi:hypothetical protein MTO96_016859 [Rhipicephalus appendiculatus]